MKNGGADVRIINGPAPNPMRDSMLNGVRNAAAGSPDGCQKIAAFAFVALYADGHTYVSTRTDFGDAPYNKHLFIGMVEESVRDYLITWDTAVEAVNKSNGYDE